MADKTTLLGNDITLAAFNSVILGKGVSISANAIGSSPDEILSIQGDGALVRVSADSAATVDQSQTDQAQIGGVVIGANSELKGEGIVLASSLGGIVDSTLMISATSATLSASRLNLDFTGAAADATGIVLHGNLLNSLFKSTSLTLNSLSTIGISGDGSLGGVSLASLAIHSGGIFGDASSPTTTDKLQAGKILIDNAFGVVDQATSLPYKAASGKGTLALSGSVISLGSGAVALGGFQALQVDASGGFVGSGKGTLNAGGDLTINAPVMTGAGGADSTLNVPNGTLSTIQTGSSLVTSGLADSLSLNAAIISLASPIMLPGGSISITQTASGQTLFLSSSLDVSGTTRQFYDKTESVDAGSISLASAGDVNLARGALLKMDSGSSGPTGVAGNLSILAPNGSFNIDPAAGISAKVAQRGTGGSFVLDTKTLASFSKLETILQSSGLDGHGGFSASQTFRIRRGDVSVNNAVISHSFSLTADSGTVDVFRSIDASGATGGNIALQASGSVILEKGSSLSVHGDSYDAASSLL